MARPSNAIEPRTSVDKSQTPMSKRQKTGKSRSGNSWLGAHLSDFFGVWRLAFGIFPGGRVLHFCRQPLGSFLLVLGPGRRSEFFTSQGAVDRRARQSLGEESPDTTGQDAARAARQVRAPRFKARRRTVSQKINRPFDSPQGGSLRVRVKRWGKSPPRRRQRRRHEKPRPVQGKIGGWAARPIAAGMPHPASLDRLGAQATQDKSART
jgi:hypothetical protein